MSKATLLTRSLRNGAVLSSTNGHTGNEKDENVYTVSITKQVNNGLGFLIRQRDRMPYFSVYEIIENSSAAKCGKIQKNDVILKVDDIDLTTLEYEKGLELLRSIKPGTEVVLTLKTGIDPSVDSPVDRKSLLAKKKPSRNLHFSPIQKIRKKFFTCVDSNKSFNNFSDLENEIQQAKQDDYFSLSQKIEQDLHKLEQLANDYELSNEETNANNSSKISNKTTTTTIPILNEITPCSPTPLSNTNLSTSQLEVKIETNNSNNSDSNLVNDNLETNLSKQSEHQKSKKLISLSHIKDPNLNTSKINRTHHASDVEDQDKQVLLQAPKDEPKDKIQIIQNGDEICINIGGNIEILTNRCNDRKVISVSPQMTRKTLTVQQQQNTGHDSKSSNAITTTQIDLENKQENKAMLKPPSLSPTSAAPTGIGSNGLTNNGSKSEVKLGEKKPLSKYITSDDLPVQKLNFYSLSSRQSLVDDLKKTPPLPKEVNKKNLVKKKGAKLKYLIDQSNYIDTLHNKTIKKVSCTTERCMASLLQDAKPQVKKTKEEVIEEAVDFINQFYASVKREDSKTHKERIEEVIKAINETGTYELKETELCFGARTAWRNAPRCIGRIQWSKLQVFDARYVTTARGMFECICNHLKYGYNKGNIRSAITVFRQRTDQEHDFRVWNSQFISYAGYRIDDKTVIGDRSQIEITEICLKLGWKPKYTEFDILPLVLQANGQDPEMFEIPSDLTVSLDLAHPHYDWFKELNLKWYCVPGVSSMMLDVGGIEFTACPFNGWYMGTEIGRDLADVNRYNKLPIIAERMGLDTRTNSSLWKDKALVELNYAILYSFQKAGVTITDHHSAADSFMKHHENENQLRGGCPADWIWVVPPLSSHLTPVFHLEMLNYNLKPSYEYQEPAWISHVWKQKNSSNEDKTKRTRRKVYFSDIARAVKFSAKLMGKALAKRVKCTILYATETGKSERFAKSLAEIFKHSFDAKCLCMRDYDVVNLGHETLLLVVTSTFGNGDPPENGQDFKQTIFEMQKDRLKALKNCSDRQSSYDQGLNSMNSMYSDSTLYNVRFAVFGLGNSSYPKFCSYGKFLDTSLNELGAERIHQIGLGDELCGQEESFRKWSVGVYKAALDTFCLDTDTSFIESISDDLSWSPHLVRLTICEDKKAPTLCEGLSKLHNRKILPCKLSSKRNLQHEKSGRRTLNAALNTQGYAGELEYKPGDHIGLFGANRKELVDTVLAKVSNAPPHDQLVNVEILKEKTTVFGVTKQWLVDERYPTCSLRTALTYYLDITSPVSQNLLMYFASQASNENDKAQMEKLAKDHLAYEEWKNSLPNLAEILEEFPSLRPNASLLVTQLPKLQPRFYSISSSPKAIADDIHITVGVVEYTPKGKSTHYGVCSKWLDELPIGEIMPAYVRGAPSFRMPEDKTLPIIMVGAGTGIAPFRSFWQERKVEMEMMQVPTGQNNRGWGELVLYFGCRQSKLDELYKNEIDELLRERVLTSYYGAYSREPNTRKTYVQDLISRNFTRIHELIFNKKGHVYICGDVRMAAEVTTVIEKCLQEKCNISVEEAKAYVVDMMENIRFHEDIFGNSVNIVQN